MDPDGAFVAAAPIRVRGMLNRAVFGKNLRAATKKGSRWNASSMVPRAAYVVHATNKMEANGTSDSEDQAEDDHKLSVGVRARTVVHICKSATLCTASIRHSGVPFGSHVDFVQDASGRPVFMLALNATHTKNLSEEPRCSLYCQPASTAGQDGCRTTLVGSVRELTGDDREELEELFIETHKHANEALQFPDAFRFFRMDVDDVLYIAGYGVISQWVAAKEFAEAQPDPLAFDAPGIVARLNETKEADLRRLSRVFLGVEDVARCKMTTLDRLGFDLRVRDEKGKTKEYRVAFREDVTNRFDAQSALVKAFQEAWERENGFDETWEGEDTRATVVYSPKAI